MLLTYSHTQEIDMTKIKSKTRATVKMGAVRESFVSHAQGAQPKGVRAGKAVRGMATVAAATVVAGVGVALGSAGGFIKGLWS